MKTEISLEDFCELIQTDKERLQAIKHLLDALEESAYVHDAWKYIKQEYQVEKARVS